MQLLYVDESGNSHIDPSNTHFVLAGIAMDAAYWKQHNEQIENIKQSYDLDEQEIHTAWLLKTYGFQEKIPNFSSLDKANRKQAAEAFIQAQVKKSSPGTRKNINRTYANC